MKQASRRAHGARLLPLGLALAAGLWLATACGPIGPLPGGALSGEIGDPHQDDWAFAADAETAQLETRPEDPHSVNVWFAALGPQLYVPTSMILGKQDPRDRSWVAHVEADPRVRIRLEGSVFAREAVRVTDPREFEEARAALESKYELDEREPDRTVWIYRLEPRS